MFYEFLKKNNLNPLVMTLVTDGVSNHSKTVAVVVSSLFENEEKRVYAFPGASPELTEQYTGFPLDLYADLAEANPRDTLKNLKGEMDDHPFVLCYNQKFLLKFLTKIPDEIEVSVSLKPDVLVDICDVAASSQYLDMFQPSEDLEGVELIEDFSRFLAGHRMVNAGVPFKTIASKVDDSMWDENIPEWERTHAKLRKAAEMY